MVYVNLETRVLTHYTSHTHSAEKVHAFTNEVQEMSRGRKKQESTVTMTQFFGAEDKVNLAMVTDGGGVAAWWQAELLLGYVVRQKLKVKRDIYLPQICSCAAEPTTVNPFSKTEHHNHSIMRFRPSLSSNFHAHLPKDESSKDANRLPRRDRCPSSRSACQV